VAAADLDPPSLVCFWSGADQLGLAVGVTTRWGGVSRPPYDTLNLGLHVGDRSEDVVRNRTRAAEAFGVPPGTLVFAEQVHGAHATEVGPDDAGRGVASLDDAVPATDVLVTTSPAVTLAILVADCVPIALVDPAAHVLATVHAGWRGTAAGVVPAALRAMAACGAQTERIHAYTAPAVAPERYQVGPEVVDALARAVAPAPLHATVVRPDPSGRARVDLVAANRQQLVAGGVRPTHVHNSGTTTADPDFFSDRAARPCGRFALLARFMS
jgi:purine-nucleoside/S-methyl-5'-thioadenosine phosphorylase / adenosine deaminase